MRVSPAFIDQVSEEASSLQAATGILSAVVEAGADEQDVAIELVSSEFFPGLRPKLSLGRGFTQQDNMPDSEPVAVISYDDWQTEYAGNRDILGTQVRIVNPGYITASASPGGSEYFRIVGVMSSELPAVAAEGTALWVPLERGILLFADGIERLRLARTFLGLGRKTPGSTPASTSRELNARYSTAAEELGLSAHSDERDRRFR